MLYITSGYVTYYICQLVLLFLFCFLFFGFFSSALSVSVHLPIFVFPSIVLALSSYHPPFCRFSVSCFSHNLFFRSYGDHITNNSDTVFMRRFYFILSTTPFFFFFFFINCRDLQEIQQADIELSNALAERFSLIKVFFYPTSK